MNQVRITRITSHPAYGTFGVLTINGEPFCVTLEPYWRSNQKNVSCIPEGMYICKKYTSPKYKETFEVTEVEGRSNILFHWGNTINDTQGCILPGTSYGNYKIYQSIPIFNKFIERLSKSDMFQLIIKSSY